MDFGPLHPRESAVDAVARIIRNAIIRGEVEPGTRLPAERQLADSFQVNRVTIRGALAKLASTRLLTPRQGSGYLVHDYRRCGGPDLLPWLVDVAVDRGDLADVVGDLLFVRRHLARAVLERLAEAGGGRRDAIAAAVERFADVVAQDESLTSIAVADFEVIAEILQATGSAVLQLCLNPVTMVVLDFPPLQHVLYAEPETNVQAYRLLLAWLDDPRPELIGGVIAELERRDAASVAFVRSVGERGDAP